VLTGTNAGCCQLTSRLTEFRFVVLLRAVTVTEQVGLCAYFTTLQTPSLV
jgi:hypothetical protein